MRTYKETTDRFLASPSAKKLHITEDNVEELLTDYREALSQTLLENGYVVFCEGVTVEVVKLSRRVYVLRNKVYYNDKRRYKLKISIWNSVYDKLTASFKDLEED